MKPALWILALWPLSLAQAEPRLLYTKTFPGSVPAYVSIRVERNGNGEYKDSPDDERPLKFHLAEADVNALFAVVERLNRLSRSLESPAKVAFMGMKTFRFEDGAEQNEVKFNFSEDLDAKLLADWFERINETEQLLISLERAAKYDKLGLNKAILQLESAMDRKRVVDAEQMLPLLDRVGKNESYLNMARQRAAAIAEAIRAPKP
jgi:hypothetical protein